MLFELWDCEFGLLDILTYTPEEFHKKKAELGVVSEAVKMGMELGRHAEHTVTKLQRRHYKDGIKYV